jgi:S1-C subfamily serine protease
VGSLTADSPAQDKLQPAPAIAKELSNDTIPVGGDVILAVDDVTVEDTEDLYTYLYLETRPNETVTFTVLRNGERQTVRVTTAEYPALSSSIPTTTRTTVTETTQTTTGPPSINTTTGRK